VGGVKAQEPAGPDCPIRALGPDRSPPAEREGIGPTRSVRATVGSASSNQTFADASGPDRSRRYRVSLISTPVFLSPSFTCTVVSPRTFSALLLAVTRYEPGGTSLKVKTPLASVATVSRAVPAASRSTTGTLGCGRSPTLTVPSMVASLLAA